MTARDSSHIGLRGSGSLTFVATPIGNLGDLSPNAVETLSAADVIACEDTRRTRKLLTHAGIARPTLVVLNEHNEAERALELIERAQAGARVAVVSDAGMPGISDPGERLVAAAVTAGVDVRAVPGPSAVVTALVVSGLATARFCFEGFLPRKGRARRERIDALACEERTTVIFEAPHRVRATLAELAEALGPDRAVAVCRELTKLHEEVWRGSVGDAAAWIADVQPRGEYVLVLAGVVAGAPAAVDVEGALRARLAAGMSKRDAAAEVASALGLPRRRVYDVATGL